MSDCCLKMGLCFMMSWFLWMRLGSWWILFESVWMVILFIIILIFILILLMFVCIVVSFVCFVLICVMNVVIWWVMSRFWSVGRKWLIMGVLRCILWVVCIIWRNLIGIWIWFEFFMMFIWICILKGGWELRLIGFSFWFVSCLFGFFKSWLMLVLGVCWVVVWKFLCLKFVVKFVSIKLILRVGLKFIVWYIS